MTSEKESTETFERNLIKNKIRRLEVGLANEPFRWQFRRKNEIKYWNYVTTGQNDIGADLKNLAKAIKISKNVPKLNLDCTQDDWVSGHGVSAVGARLEGKKSLKSFKFAVQEPRFLKDSAFLPLSKGLKRCPSLQNLEVSLAECFLMTDIALKYLGQGLKDLFSLKTLNLDFSLCRKFTDTGLVSLTKGFKRLVSLQDFSLRLNRFSNITNAGLIGFGENLNRCISLKKISLIFFECYKISDQGFMRLCEALQGLESLKEIRLDFRQCNISNTGLAVLGRTLKKLKNLESINIDFFENIKINDKGLLFVSGNLKELASLKSLRLGFACCHITNEGLKSLSEDIKELSTLRYIKFDLGGMKGMTKEGVAQLDEELAENLPEATIDVYQNNLARFL